MHSPATTTIRFGMGGKIEGVNVRIENQIKPRFAAQVSARDQKRAVPPRLVQLQMGDLKKIVTLYKRKGSVYVMSGSETGQS
jgi:hypothetical protein